MLRRRKTFLFKVLDVDVDYLDTGALSDLWDTLPKSGKFIYTGVEIQYSLIESRLAGVTFKAYKVVRRRD